MLRTSALQLCAGRACGMALYVSLLNHFEMPCYCDLPKGHASRFSLPLFCSSELKGLGSFKVFTLDMIGAIIVYSHVLC